MQILFSRRGRAAVLFAGITLFDAGCTTSTYQVKVDAISRPSAGPTTAGTEPQSYKIKSKNPALGDENLRYNEAAGFVKTALSSKGLYEAPSQDRADMIVELEYGVDAPRTKIESIIVPVYAPSGGGVRYEQMPMIDTRGNTTFRTVAVYRPPVAQSVGFDEVPQEVIIYEKYLHVTARENKPGREGRPPSEVWSVSVSTEDESRELRKYLPILASAAADYIGKDSTGQRTVTIKDPSQLTTFIRNGMDGPAASVVSNQALPPKS